MKNFRTLKLNEDERQDLNNLINDNKHLNPNVVRALYARGVKTSEQIHYFFNQDLDDLISYKAFTNGDRMVETLKSLKNVKIVIAGDYDCDGINGTSIGKLSLSKFGYDVGYYINAREIGYGLKPASVDKILELYPDCKVILTVDNGITAFEGVDYANSKGIRVLVTDHHKSESKLPNAEIIVNPNSHLCESKFKGNCGAVVMWKIMLGLAQELGNPNYVDYVYELLDLCALATIADQVPLLEDNRIIVKKGLELLNRGSRFSLETLMKIARLEGVKTETVGFYIAPLLNSVNRLEQDCNLAVRMLTSDYEDKDFIVKFSELMIKLNDQRKKLSDIQTELACALIDDMIEKRGGVPNVIVVEDTSFSEGVVGIIASRVTEKYNRPSLVMCYKDDVLKGSARSIDPVNIKEEFDKCSDCFLSYGGHEYAAGFSLEDSNLEKLQSALESNLSHLSAKDFSEEVLIDFVLNDDKMKIISDSGDFSVCEMFDCLEPFGSGFPKPRYLYQNFNVDMTKSVKNSSNSVYVGADKRTLRLVNPNWLVAIMFKHAHVYSDLGEPQRVHLVGRPSVNEYNGRKSIQFVVESDYVLKAK